MAKSKSAYSDPGKKGKLDTHIIVVWVDNEAGVLARVVGLFSGRGYNIESLAVAEVDPKRGISRITIVTTGTPQVIEQIKLQLGKLVPVHKVADFMRGDKKIIFKEMALLKLVGNTTKRNKALKVCKKFNPVDSFIHVAAFTERGTILSTTEENYDKNFNVNVKAPLFMMQDVIKIMIRDKKKGTIAHILSMAGYSGMPFLTAYSSSKAALAVMIKNVANSVSGHQIRVNGVNLGWTDTPAETVIQKKFHNADDNWLKKAESKVPFKRLNKPLDVAKILAFLCSDESGIMTGSIVDFDQTVAGWHSYSAYDTKVLDDSILGE